jgi:hypothetical protein
MMLSSVARRTGPQHRSYNESAAADQRFRASFLVEPRIAL